MGLHTRNNRRKHLENLILSKASISASKPDQEDTDEESASAKTKKGK